MIHARWEGETFGLACAEFLIRSKPIITWAESRERNHILLADRSSILYNTASDLYSILSNITKEYLLHKSHLVPSSHLSSYSFHSIKSTLFSLLSSH